MQIASEAGLARDHSELARSRIKIRSAQVRVFDKIIGFGAEFEPAPVVDLKGLKQGEVPILQASLAQTPSRSAKPPP